MSIRKIIYSLLCLFLFLLPWQTRWVYQPAFIGGQFWEYGSDSWYATEVLLWLIIILFVIDNFAKRSFWRQVFSRVDYTAHKKRLWLVLFFLLFWLVNILFSIDSEISYNFFFHILEALCLGVVIVYFQTNQKNNLLIYNNYLHWSLWSGGVIQGIFALYQFFTQHVPRIPGFGLAAHYPFEPGANVVETTYEHWLRAYGSLGGANPLGIYLAVIFFIGLIMYLYSRPWQKIILTAGQAFILIGLFFSFSRGAWIACISGAIIFIIFLLKGKNRAHNFLLMLKPAIFSLLILTTLFFISKQIILTRFNPTVRLETQSLAVRQSQIKEAWQIFRQHPVLGVGPGAFTLELHRLRPWAAVWNLLPVHNIYLLALAEVGLLGFSVFMLSIGWLLRKIYQSNQFYLSVLAVLLVAGLFEHWLWDLYVGQLFFGVVLSLGFSLKLQQK